jgi:hypothetical protein
MFINTYINDLHISEGDSYRGDCPLCKGKNTFTASKVDGTIVFNCYRVSCGSKGKVSVGLNREDIYNLMNKSPSLPHGNVEEFQMPPHVTHDISKPIIKAFMSRWGLHKNLSASYIMYDVKDDRLVFPLRDENGTLIDAIGRSLVGGHPKWLRYSGRADYYVQHTWRGRKKAIIVEDVVSSLVVYDCFPDVDGVAILGTNLNHRHIDFLSKYEHCVVALDPDARSKTVAYTKELKNYVSEVTAYPLTDDIKYKRVEDIEGLKEVLA